MSSRAAIERAAVLLRVVVKFIEENNLEDRTVFYDGVECDGWCLSSDCSAGASALDGAD